MKAIDKCWCGSENLVTFSSQYKECQNCKSLVIMNMPELDDLRVSSDDTDFYGKHYYESHLVQDYDYPTLSERARSDLSERCLYWLRTILKYKLPPANVLELGCAHGGFVAILKQAGYEAKGLELSPTVAEYAQKTFDVPVLCGPIENQEIEPGSLDVIALMDVIEHLPDPLSTMQHCLELLKKDGILVIQCPCYPENITHEDMVSRQHPFLQQLKADEHLYLFSKRSIRDFFAHLGIENLEFEPAIFSHYDMFLVVGKEHLRRFSEEEITRNLSATPNGRIIQALLDLYREKGEVLSLAKLTKQLEESEKDRAARLEVIEGQGERISYLEAEVDRWLSVARGEDAVLAKLTKQLEESEKDRAARLEVIEGQGERISYLEAEVDRWLLEAKEKAELLADLTNKYSTLVQAIQKVNENKSIRIMRFLGLLKEIDNIIIISNI